MSVLAHIGGIPFEESLIYLVPPLAVVAWIWVLGRRARRDPPLPPLPPEESPGDEAAVAPTGEGGDHSDG